MVTQNGCFMKLRRRKMLNLFDWVLVVVVPVMVGWIVAEVIVDDAE